MTIAPAGVFFHAHVEPGAAIKPYAAYLFDADGTLIDTTELIYRCFVYTIKQFAGREASREEVVRAIGLPLRAQMEMHFGPLSDRQFEERSNAHMAYQYSIYREYLKVFPGVQEMLARLKLCGRRCAVVTSRRRESLERFLEETGIREYFGVLVTPESTLRHKPHPDPALEALRLLGVEPVDALMVGDSVFDMECGAAAGADTAFALWGGAPPPGRLRPTYLLASPLDMAAV